MRLIPRRRRTAAPGPILPGRTELRLERARYVPGETVRGSVVVPGGGSAAAIRVALNLRERSTEYEAVVRSIAVELAAGGDEERERRFAIELPADALPSLAGRHGGLSWTVDAGAEGEADPAASLRIEVAPEPAAGGPAGASADPGAG